MRRFVILGIITILAITPFLVLPQGQSTSWANPIFIPLSGGTYNDSLPIPTVYGYDYGRYYNVSLHDGETLSVTLLTGDNDWALFLYGPASPSPLNPPGFVGNSTQSEFTFTTNGWNGWPGNYSIEVYRNSLAQGNYTLIVSGLAQVCINPTSVTLHELESLNFLSTITGGSPPYIDYQWYLNGSAVSGANSSSWTFALYPMGNYSVYLNVTDSLGNSATSNQASVMVVNLLGDINNDGKVDMKDIGVAARAFGTVPGDPRWNPNADVNNDGKIDMTDIGIIARHVGQHYP